MLSSISLSAQSPTCYTTPDGTDVNSWSYKDYVIPTGYKLDSVMFSATRTGYPASNEDFIFDYCAGTTTYNQGTAVEPWNYITDNNSEYNHWINLTSFGYTSIGIVRVHLPTNAGATWNQVCFAISQTGTCFATPDGTDGNGWSYKDFIIPAGHKMDSVYMDATRAGYPTSDYDFIFDYCAGITIYNQGTAVEPWNYITDNNSEYGHWINLTSFNYTSTGMVRATLPTVAGAVWNQVCFATSQITGIQEQQNASAFKIYPNPADAYLIIKTSASKNKLITAELITLTGQTIKMERKAFSGTENELRIDLSDVHQGFYFVKVGNNVQKVQVIK
ncbi:MAG TPA: T9SS type A sorting domain-containing protein [Bacteroidia bacterium]|nr:T9SS type A sorting domain-containing protein [Bacteroidia bacterium]